MVREEIQIPTGHVAYNVYNICTSGLRFACLMIGNKSSIAIQGYVGI